MIKYKCPHGRPRRRCRECGGADFCEHDSQRRYCKKCKALGIGGVGICEHDHQRHQCPVCKPESAYKPTKRNAEKRYLSFPITSGQFVSVVSQPCFYCGEDV